MCRIVGVWSEYKNSSLYDLVGSMKESLSYGGPDDHGIFIDEKNNLGFGHRRLSILDLSFAGHQPMEFGKYVITYNGEIYNYREIATELIENGYEIKTDSDTEVILKAFDCWNYKCVDKFRGMFSFGIWNKDEKILTLCRDRVGVKPLYWYLKDGLFMFSSELKAFHEHPDFDKTISDEAVSLYLQTGYIRSPYCIFNFAHKVEPGTFLEINSDGHLKSWKYWDLVELSSNLEVDKRSETELIESCENILKESFQLRMVSDVPVGIFLSGGIDSSLVAALLQNQSRTPLKTFTIGFQEEEFNEAVFAKKIANHLGTDHTELYCTESHFKEIIPKLPLIYDEPFGDSSAIPTYLVSQLAKQDVKVSLSADGGDEIFTGYTKYLIAIEYYKKLVKIPLLIRKIISNLLIITPVSILNFGLSLTRIKGKTGGTKDRYKKMAQAIKCNSVLDFLYKSSQITSDEQLSKLHRSNQVKIFDINYFPKSEMTCSMLGLADITSYLEGDILTKIDRATMNVALEGREPFLDHKIIEFGMSLADNMKVRNKETKWILRQILYKYIPKELIERPKMGFAVPIEKWLRSSLKTSLIELTENKEFASYFKLHQDELQNIIGEFLKGKSNKNTYLIWYLYSLNEWYKTWIQNDDSRTDLEGNKNITIPTS